MPSSDQTRTTEWRTASRFYRRPPGWGWLLGLLAIPLLLGAVGYHTLPKAHVNVPSVRAPSVSVPSLPSAPALPSVSIPNVGTPGLSFAPLSIMRNGNDITLNGHLPDGAARTSLLDALKGTYGPDVNLIDKTDMESGVTTPDAASVGTVFKAAASIPNFAFKLDRDTLTLAGTAASDQEKAAVEDAAKAAWPNMKITNEIQVTAPSTGGAVMAPGTGNTEGCANLSTDVAGLLRTPITFDTDSSALSAAAQQQLTQVATRVKTCSTAKIAVTGYTDSTGNDAINNPLSDNRAKSVVDFLVSNGVPAGQITSKGLGATSPVASNDTTGGRAENRRVMLNVS